MSIRFIAGHWLVEYAGDFRARKGALPRDRPGQGFHHGPACGHQRGRTCLESRLLGFIAASLCVTPVSAPFS